MQGGFMSFVLLVVLVYMIFRTASLGMRTKKNQDMIKILNQMDEPEEFYKEADAYIEANKDPEFAQKVAILRLFADAAYDHDDLFLKHLEELDINLLLDIGKKKKDGFSQNEDSFFYLYLAIPNMLESKGKTGLDAKLVEKMDAYKERLSRTMLVAMNNSLHAYYNKEGDLGLAFDQSVLDGDYAQYTYSKQLVGLYKQMIEAKYTRLARDRGDTEAAGTYVDDLKHFSSSRLGKRWLSEFHLDDLIEVDETKDDVDEEKTEEDKPEDKTAEETPVEETKEESSDTAETKDSAAETKDETKDAAETDINKDTEQDKK